MDGLITGKDGQQRCWWPGEDAGYLVYHDQEWGRPVKDDVKLFEKICLEGFQAGLSWLTILRKRENFRTAFDQFQFERVARYTESTVEQLLQNSSIVRHRRKIESTINNAQRACDLVDEYGSLASYFWQYEPKERPSSFNYATLSKLSKTSESIALSKDLKRRGWSFIGPTTAYAFMQAMGLVNDHLDGCFARDLVQAQRSLFEHPYRDVSF
ncbi:MAG: DNA-3-methyladenine glycosylase I [Cyanobacteria bacterium P01_D01_bin.156]